MNANGIQYGTDMGAVVNQYRMYARGKKDYRAVLSAIQRGEEHGSLVQTKREPVAGSSDQSVKKSG